MTQINLETKVELMAQDITYIKSELAEIKQLVKDVGDSKANKWVEDAVRYALYTVAGIIIAAIMGLIIIKTNTKI